jgi:hypothetical protein
MGLAWLFVLGVVIQFVLAGLGVMGGESIEAHREWGFTALHLLPLLMLIAALVGRMGWRYIGFTFLALVLVSIQPLLASDDLDPEWLRSLHVLNALFIFGLAHWLAQQSTRLMRAERGAVAGA